jgi:uncharacterized protein YndB with AHSA1/START domain
MNMRRFAGMLACVLLLLAVQRSDQPHAAANAMHLSATSDRELVLTREFAAPRSVVFDALTQPEHVVRWLKPTHLILVGCDIDLRRGGTLRYVFQRPSGARVEVRGSYQVVEPPQRLVYLESYDFSPLRVLVATTLTETANGTRLAQTLTYAAKEERDADREGVVADAAHAYDELERYLQSRRPFSQWTIAE